MLPLRRVQDIRPEMQPFEGKVNHRIELVPPVTVVREALEMNHQNVGHRPDLHLLLCFLGLLAHGAAPGERTTNAHIRAHNYNQYQPLDLLTPFLICIASALFVFKTTLPHVVVREALPTCEVVEARCERHGTVSAVPSLLHRLVVLKLIHRAKVHALHRGETETKAKTNGKKGAQAARCKRHCATLHSSSLHSTPLHSTPAPLPPHVVVVEGDDEGTVACGADLNLGLGPKAVEFVQT